MKRPRAFTLTEVLFVLGMLPIFMLVATELYRGIMDTASSAQRQLSAQATFDAASAQLWRDVFTARQIRSADSGFILITQRDGTQVRWQATGTDLIRIAHDRRLFTPPWDSAFQVGLSDGEIALQLRRGTTIEDESHCASPAKFWSGS